MQHKHQSSHRNVDAIFRETRYRDELRSECPNCRGFGATPASALRSKLTHRRKPISRRNSPAKSRESAHSDHTPEVQRMLICKSGKLPTLPCGHKNTEDNKNGRQLKKEEVVCVELWRKSPSKDRLAYYGVGYYKPEAVKFNQVIEKCVKKVDSTTIKNSPRPTNTPEKETSKSKSKDRLTGDVEKTISWLHCQNSLNVVKPLIRSETQVDPSKFCSEKHPEQKARFWRRRHKPIESNHGVEYMDRTTELGSYEKAYINEMEKLEKEASGEHENYKELFFKLLRCVHIKSRLDFDTGDHSSRKFNSPKSERCAVNGGEVIGLTDVTDVAEKSIGQGKNGSGDFKHSAYLEHSMTSRPVKKSKVLSNGMRKRSKSTSARSEACKGQVLAKSTSRARNPKKDAQRSTFKKKNEEKEERFRVPEQFTGKIKKGAGSSEGAALKPLKKLGKNKSFESRLINGTKFCNVTPILDCPCELCRLMLHRTFESSRWGKLSKQESQSPSVDKKTTLSLMNRTSQEQKDVESPRRQQTKGRRKDLSPPRKQSDACKVNDCLCRSRRWEQSLDRLDALQKLQKSYGDMNKELRDKVNALKDRLRHQICDDLQAQRMKIKS